MEKKNSSLVQVKLFSGTLEDVEKKLCVFYSQKEMTFEEAKENTKFPFCKDGKCVAAVYYKEKNPVI
ncbi:MAG: hypothetical protein V1661_02505 [bacterium]